MRDPVLVVLITRRPGLHVRYPRELLLRLLFSIANHRVSGDAVLHRAQPNLLASSAHVGDFGGNAVGWIAVHHVRVARARYQLLGGRALTPRVNRGPRASERFRLENRLLDLVVAARMAESWLRPDSVHDAQPFVGARVAVVVLLEVDAVAPGFVLPPRRDDVEREASARDVIDVRRLLGEDCRLVKSRAHRHHQLQLFSHRCERRRGGPRLERIRIDSLDVVHEQLGDQGDVIADLLTALREAFHVVPGGAHVFVGDVPQPSAENGEPVSVPHQAAPAAAAAAAAAAAPTAATSAPAIEELVTRPTR